MEKKVGQRIAWVDLAKGICMLLVIAGHIFWGPGNHVLPDLTWVDNCMATFRMPLYFVLCGIFFKTYDGFSTFLHKKAYNLLIPFGTFFLIGSAMHQWGAIWFLGCLFVINVLGYLLIGLLHRYLPQAIRRLLMQHRVLLFLCFCAFALLCGWVGSNIHLESLTEFPGFITWNLQYMGTSIVALPFFLFGYLLRSHTNLISAQSDSIGVEVGGAMICLAIVVLLCWSEGWPEVVYALNQYSLTSPSLYVCGLFGTLSILLISRVVVHVPIVSYIGRYSIIVLLTHPYLILLMNSFERHILGTSLNATYWMACYILLLVLEIPVIWLGKSYLPFIFAQRK